MVKPVRRASFFAAALLSVSLLHAKDLAAYRVGDTADADITTPVALDVIDPAATAALKSAEALKTSAVFRDFTDATNRLADEFHTAFAAARTSFLADVADNFHSPTVDETTIASADFGYLITAFNVKNKNFPVTSELAAEWARGNDGNEMEAKLLGSLLAVAQRPLRPDDLPAGFVVGETLRLAPVTSTDQKISAADIQRCWLVTEPNVTAISRARAQFRHGFPADQQPFARALADFLNPNCVPDATLTQALRDRAVRQMVVAEHFDAGQTIIHRGDLIDGKNAAVLGALAEKLMPGLLNQQIAAERQRAEQQQAQALQASNAAQQAQDEASRLRSESQLAQSQTLKIRVRNGWLVAALAAVSSVALVVVARLISSRKKVLPPPMVPAPLPPNNFGALSSDLAPHVAQAVREAVMQELAMQRRELMLAQQSASDEITALVRRLDELQMPMQEWLRAYETQIQSLEKELAARTEENRELLKLKIEMMRRQLESERTRTAGFN